MNGEIGSSTNDALNFVYSSAYLTSEEFGPDPEVLTTAKSLGSTGIGYSFHWNRIEKVKGDFNWEHFDVLFEHCHNLNLQIFPLLAYSPSWASWSGCSCHVDVEHYIDFAVFVYEVVKRYMPDGAYASRKNNPPIR